MNARVKPQLFVDIKRAAEICHDRWGNPIDPIDEARAIEERETFRREQDTYNDTEGEE